MSNKDKIEELGRHEPYGSSESRKFPYIRSPLYGDLPAPEDLGMLLHYLEDVRWALPWLECWRGQASIDWRLDSTAARRLLEYDTDIEEIIYEGTLEQRVRNYETRLLDQARMAGHGIYGGRELSDLELLSVLRHYGAATRLMDFSRNVMVALWFASSNTDYEEDYGLLVGLEADPSRILQTESDLRAPITDLVDREDVREGQEGEERRELGYWTWEPRHLFERMRAQQSLFVFGQAIERTWGTAPFPLDPTRERYREEGDSKVVVDNDPLLIAVPASLKGSMVVDGPEIFGYDSRSLFPDIEGFSQYHGAGQRFEKRFFVSGDGKMYP